jgi:hypothetical protein
MMMQTTPTQRLTFQAQGHYVVVSLKEVGMKSQPGNGSRRGKITHFSKKSRKRLLEMTARLDLNRILGRFPAIFVTLTYGQLFPKPAIAKSHLRALLERIRRIAPDASGIWRLEFQERGAPHFHVIFFNLPYIDKYTISSMWSDIIGSEFHDVRVPFLPRTPFTRIEAIRHPRRVMAYVSKYVAKHANKGGFNDVPYPHANGDVGRFWGVFAGDNLPWAELITLIVTGSRKDVHETLWQYRRLMAKQWPRANKSGRYRGASLFVDHSKPWFKAFLWTMIEFGGGYNACP